MNISKISIKRPVTTLMCVVAIILLGFVSLSRLNLDLMPKMDLPYALAYVTYSGVGPEEIENTITKPIESVLGTVTNVKTIQSQSSSGMGLVFLEFNEGTDLNVATLQMREKIDMIKSYLPSEASSLTVMQMDMNMMPVMVFTVTGGGKYDIVELNRIVEDRIQGRLEKISGVASVSVSGGMSKEIAVQIYPDKLKGFGITTQQISALLASENLNQPVGTIKQGDMDLTVRTIGEFRTVEEIKNLPITTATGTIIHLSDVANVEEGYKKQSSYAYVNGEKAISLSISKQSTANTVNLSNAVNKEMEKIKAEMPDVQVATTVDQAVYVQGTVNAVSQAAIYGATLAVLILFVFLRNLRSTLVVGTSIPISVIATFMLMYFSGITLNMISLGGLALGVGMLIDNSIVVLENIFRHREMGKDRKAAALDGTKEVSMAVTASTITTVAVFLPIVFVQGIAAQLFRELAMTVSFSTAASLVVALTWVPMLSAIILKVEVYDEKRAKRLIPRMLTAIGRALEKLDTAYRRLLIFATKHLALITIITLVFFIGTLALVPTVGMEFFGSMDQGEININVEMPKGTLLEETALKADEVVKIVEQIPEKENIFLTMGSGGDIFSGGASDSASITLKLVGIKERDRSADEIVEQLRQNTRSIAGAEISVSSASSMSTGGAGIDLTIYGDKLDELESVANDVRDIVATVEGTREVKTSMEVGSPEAAIRINRNKASVYGVTAAQVAGVLHTAVAGSTATKFKENGTETDIIVRQDSTNINYITDIENIIIQTATGSAIPLYELAEITNQNAPVSIARENQARIITVTADVFGRDTNSVAQEVTKKLADYKFPSGYRYKFTGSQEQMMESFISLGLALVLSILLVYMVMAAQFESLLYPFIIIMSIPVALTGGIAGLIILGIPLSIVGFIGLIMLAGIVLNNAIVLVDYINQLIERGMGLNEAIVLAGPTRLRPILMTTVSTVLGLMPMMLAGGDGMEMQKPLATVVIFGLTLSTLVTLVYIPVLYIQMNRLKGFAKRVLKIKDEPKEEALTQEEQKDEEKSETDEKAEEINEQTEDTAVIEEAPEAAEEEHDDKPPEEEEQNKTE